MCAHLHIFFPSYAHGGLRGKHKGKNSTHLVTRSSPRFAEAAITNFVEGTALLWFYRIPTNKPNLFHLCSRINPGIFERKYERRPNQSVNEGGKRDNQREWKGREKRERGKNTHSGFLDFFRSSWSLSARFHPLAA